MSIVKLFEEKKKYDLHGDNQVLQAKEYDSIARAILETATEKRRLTAQEIYAVDWAKKRLGCM